MLPYPDHTDEQLVALLKHDDHAAFTELFNRYHKPVYGYVFTQVKSEEPTEDIVHDVFLKIWEKRQELNIETSFAGYIYRSCRNKAVDWFRKVAASHALRTELINTYNNLLNEQPISESDQRKMDEYVEEALDTLSPQRRKVFELCRQEGKSYQEVAAELGISHNTVKEHTEKLFRIYKQKRTYSIFDSVNILRKCLLKKLQ